MLHGKIIVDEPPMHIVFGNAREKQGLGINIQI